MRLVAVRSSAGHLLDRDDARRAGLVFHEYGPVKALSQLLGIETRNHVGQTAGRIGYDDPDWFRWIGLRRRLRCDDGETKCAPKRRMWCSSAGALGARSACRRIV